MPRSRAVHAAAEPLAANIDEFEKNMPQLQRILSPARSRSAICFSPHEGHVKIQVGMRNSPILRERREYLYFTSQSNSRRGFL
jgi:hypothetical protein